MTAHTLLRIAAGLTLFQALGHTFGAVLAPAKHGVAEESVRDAMKQLRVTEMGMERSYWDFYFGSGWTITALLVGAAAVMWFLAPIVRDNPTAARPILLALTLSYAGVTAVSARYFVTAPIIVAALITVALGVAFWRAGAA